MSCELKHQQPFTNTFLDKYNAWDFCCRCFFPALAMTKLYWHVEMLKSVQKGYHSYKSLVWIHFWNLELLAWSRGPTANRITKGQVPRFPISLILCHLPRNKVIQKCSVLRTYSYIKKNPACTFFWFWSQSLLNILSRTKFLRKNKCIGSQSFSFALVSLPSSTLAY